MENKQSNKWKGQQLVRFVFEAAMSVLYLVFALVFLFPSLFHFQFASQFEGIRVALGIILGVYGIFRIYRVIKKLR